MEQEINCSTTKENVTGSYTEVSPFLDLGLRVREAKFGVLCFLIFFVSNLDQDSNIKATSAYRLTHCPR